MFVDVTSPVPPNLIARNVGFGKPEEAKTSPSATAGDGVTPSPSLTIVQRSFPLLGSKP
jgi:hypothetical protein